jgi:hypothetical protein
MCLNSSFNHKCSRRLQSALAKKKLKTFSELIITNPVIPLQGQLATKQDSTHIATSMKVKIYFFLIKLQ